MNRRRCCAVPSRRRRRITLATGWPLPPRRR